MADRGFDINDIMPEGTTLITPAFMCRRSQLSADDEARSRNVASVRIHVEQAIARIKVFKILKQMFPLQMVTVLEKVWVTKLCA